MSACQASRVFDPTASDDLIALKERTRNYVLHSGITDTESAPSTALVLSGGGGKGAYEAGCLLALWDCGLRNFQAIAGTSVGALNAALFKRLLGDGDRDVVLKVWADLRFRRVLKGSPWTVAKLLLYIPVSILSFQKLPFQKLPSPNCSHDSNLQIGGTSEGLGRSDNPGLHLVCCPTADGSRCAGPYRAWVGLSASGHRHF
jgi:hypothetical protein